MTTRSIALAPSLFVLACLVTPAAAQQDNEALKKDLTAVIALQGQPCGEVVEAASLATSTACTTTTRGGSSSRSVSRKSSHAEKLRHDHSERCCRETQKHSHTGF
jgi:hypothetical protein